MDDVLVFNNHEFGFIRTVLIDNEPWFVGKDVASALGYSNTKDAVSSHVDSEDKKVLLRSENTTLEIPNRGLGIINESGVYSLIFGSKLKKAKDFKRWVTSEVLPEIRKTGMYSKDNMQDMLSDTDFLENTVLALIKQKKENERLLKENLEKEQKLLEAKPKVDFCDMILKSNGSVSVTTIAEDYGITPHEMNLLLKDRGVQYKRGKRWYLRKPYLDSGYAKSETFSVGNNNMSVTHLYWTQKGRLFIYNLLKKDGILPLLEKLERGTSDGNH